MRFGPVSIGDAVGGVLAHGVREGDLVLKKGTVITSAHVAQLFAAGVAQVTVAQLEAGDVAEDAAASALATGLAGSSLAGLSLAGAGLRIDPSFTGRANLFAEVSGLLVIDRAAIDGVNSVDDAITVATLPAYRRVAPGEMVATVKIIPYAVAEAKLAQALAKANGALHIAPFQPKRIGVISTLLPGLKATVVEKTVRVLRERLQAIDQGASNIVSDIRVHHEVDDLVEALRNTRALGADIIIVFGASAIADRRDIIPVALEAAGGSTEHFGMPVDPGNLLLLGALQDVPVIGAPGCARSPAENGFDWVLQRALANIPVRRTDVQAMGVGGLLMEIGSRPQPRAPEAVAALLLAAGSSRRMGRNKLLEMLHGKPLVRHVAEAALASKASPVTVVLGHEAEEVEAALTGLDVHFVLNSAHATGMASSLRAGLGALPASAPAALVLLGDMPKVSAQLINQLLQARAGAPGAQAVVPLCEGQRGNPVVLARRLFADAAALTGDTGARKLLAESTDILEVETADPAVLMDADTPEALADLKRL
jgi:molybdenum cofactor cytidylyltransferase